MTKYVLNSGGIGNNLELGKKFFTEVFRGMGDKPKLLICCFAQPRENWESKFDEDKKGIIDLVPEGVSPILELAFPETFGEQIKNTDAIYIHGGDDHLIMYWFEKFKIPNLWRDKVIATNSASSNVLSRYFWTCDWRQLMEGMGILPIKFLAHYKSSYGDNDPRGAINWEKAYEELKNYGDEKLPIYALEEGHYQVLET